MLRIGTSGWIYRHWRGIFYPERLPQKSWFDFYAGRFDTVEVNFSFYRLPSPETFQGWRARAPAGFTYAVKGSRFITHIRRLREPAEHLARFAEHARGLGDRLGPVLWQLPPDFQRDDERLAGFLSALPNDMRHTIEFRHASWLAEPVYRALAERGVALCIPDSPKLPQALRLTAPWTYVRFHGYGPDGNYTPDALDRWAERVRALQGEGAEEVWLYFNNDWHGFAIGNAEGLRARLMPAGEARLDLSA